MDIAAALARDSRRRIVPTWLAIALAVRRGRAAWADGERRERSLAVMAPLARTPEQRERLARRHLIEDTVREALLERPSAFPRAPQTGRAALEAARAGGRGVLVSYCHYGPFPWMARSFTALGPVTAVVGSSGARGAHRPIPRGLRIARWHRGFVRSACT